MPVTESSVAAIVIALSGGNDTAKVNGGNLTSGLIIYGDDSASDNDTIHVSNINASALFIDTGDGNNTITVSNVTTTNTAFVQCGNGDEHVSFSHVTAGNPTAFGTNGVFTGNGHAVVNFSNDTFTLGVGGNGVATLLGSATVSMKNVA